MTGEYQGTPARLPPSRSLRVIRNVLQSGLPRHLSKELLRRGDAASFQSGGATACRRGLVAHSKRKREQRLYPPLNRIGGSMNHRTHREVREARALRQRRSGMPGERMKRFTIDVPESLHRRVKAQCALRGVKMADYLRQTLEKLFPPK